MIELAHIDVLQSIFSWAPNQKIIINMLVDSKLMHWH